MSEVKNGTSPAAPKPPAANPDEDLSAEIARTVSKSAIEQVTCRRVTRNHYRCNWWAPEGTTAYDNPGMSGLLVTTNRVSKSRFLHVTRTSKGLEIVTISSERTKNDD